MELVNSFTPANRYQELQSTRFPMDSEVELSNITKLRDKAAAAAALAMKLPGGATEIRPSRLSPTIASTTNSRTLFVVEAMDKAGRLTLRLEEPTFPSSTTQNLNRSLSRLSNPSPE